MSVTTAECRWKMHEADRASLANAGALASKRAASMADAHVSAMGRGASIVDTLGPFLWILGSLNLNVLDPESKMDWEENEKKKVHQEIHDSVNRSTLFTIRLEREDKLSRG